MIFGFRKFPVYKDGREFRKDLKQFSREKFPDEERFVLRAQLWRALDSIVLNIAEGSDKYSKLDSGRYMNNALGSLNEVVSCLDLACDDRYITAEERDSYIVKAERLATQLMAMSASFRRKHYE